MAGESIASYKRAKEIIARNNFSIKKSLGQNFLIDGHVLNKIITVADIQKNDLVIEIGPGLGGLTQALAEAAGQVAAVELDKELVTLLEENLRAYSNVEIINGDILKLDMTGIISERAANAKVVANLPYYITTPIIMDILEKRRPVTSLTVMVQKEVADRMKARPGCKDYGALSLAVQYYAEVYLAANVPSNCFLPRPGVDSAVVHLTVYGDPPVKVKNEEVLFQIIQAAFGQRRKTLVNCLNNYFGIDKAKCASLLKRAGLDEQIRGEALDLADFARLADDFESGEDHVE